jgi:hypothetical protein
MTPRPQPEHHDNVCAEEDFCKGCDNFDAFFNSCKKAAYKTRIGGKKEKIHPATNGTRWLLAGVGCASDTRTHPHTQTPAKDFVDTPEKPWCYPGCMLVERAKEQAARAATLATLDKLKQWICEDRESLHRMQIIPALILHSLVIEKIESLRRQQAGGLE